ncbi:MAG TPA: MFS transporter [Verrucomicrobiae bacterium]|nr:MFS transporter [Verrucomicrobiae bacterium]
MQAAPSQHTAAPGTAKSPGHFRWAICGLLFASVAINYIDRNIIGILKKPLSDELGWGETDYAHIASGFQLAYAFGYLLGGRFMDWMGVKRGLPLAVLFWSLAAAAHGLCTYIPLDANVPISIPWTSISWTIPGTVFGFMAARVALGLAEGGNFPGAIKTVAEWFPVKERALATGLFNAGTNVGAIICPIAVPWMYKAWGWPMTFYVTGALGIFWLIAWWWLYDNPEKHRRLSEGERDYIRSGQPQTIEKKESVPWLSLLGYRAVWAYLAASILAGPVWGIYMFFLPDFLQKKYDLPLVQVGNWTAVFYLIASFGGIAGGWLSGRLLTRGWTINAARKISLLACALSVLPIFLAPHVPSIWLTVIIVGIAGSAHQGWSANLFSFVSDTMPKKAISSVVGLGGFVAFLTGAFVAELIGVILKKTGSYASIFAAASIMYLLSLTILHLLVPRIGGKSST